MKKITALALTSAMVLSLAACGGSSSDTKTSDDSKKASTGSGMLPVTIKGRAPMAAESSQHIVTIRKPSRTLSFLAL